MNVVLDAGMVFEIKKWKSPASFCLYRSWVMSQTSANGCTQLTLTFALTLSLGLLCWPLGEVRGQTALPPALILQDLLGRFGENGTISVPQLRSLLARLSTEQSGETTPSTSPMPDPPNSTVSDSQYWFLSQAHVRSDSVTVLNTRGESATSSGRPVFQEKDQQPAFHCGFAQNRSHF